MDEVEFLRQKATEIRIELIKMVYQAKTGHTGSSLGITDILTTLYYGVLNVNPLNPDNKTRDRFILSKGHAVESYYCILADQGFFPKEELGTFCKYGSRLIGHPNNKVPGVEMNTGALGHGLSISVGMALAGKMDQVPYRVFTVMGDGELAEGSVWEAAMAASNYQLDNLIGIIDRNGLQISGSTEDVMALESLADKWRSFGWRVLEVDGHDHGQLLRALRSAPEVNGRPTLIIAHTIKGKGISFAENVVHWHHHVPSEDEFQRAIDELQIQLGGIVHDS